jgi:hypothetical protein
MQKKKKDRSSEPWRPSVVCVSKRTFENNKAQLVLRWIANRYGFGTYIHLMEDYFSTASNNKASEVLEELIQMGGDDDHSYMDTLISPSYTSAIAQTIQLPGISGMTNNMILFEFDKESGEGLEPIIENVSLPKAAKMDICILASTHKNINFKNGIHVWIRSIDHENANLMILLSYIILGHPDWKKGKIKIFEIAPGHELDKSREKLTEIIQSGRLPISPKNIEIIELDENVSHFKLINERSKGAGLSVVGFREEQLKHDKNIFSHYKELGDVLFVNASQLREIT